MADFYFKFVSKESAQAQILGAFVAAGHSKELRFEPDGITIKESFARPNFSICCYPNVFKDDPSGVSESQVSEPGYFVFVRAIGPIAELVSQVAPANQNRDLEGNNIPWSDTSYHPWPGF